MMILYHYAIDGRTVRGGRCALNERRLSLHASEGWKKEKKKENGPDTHLRGDGGLPKKLRDKIGEMMR